MRMPSCVNLLPVAVLARPVVLSEGPYFAVTTGNPFIDNDLMGVAVVRPNMIGHLLPTQRVAGHLT